MLLALDEKNQVIVTEKFLMVKDLRNLYDKHAKNPDIAVAHFAVIFYMFHFESKFLWEYRDDESKRLVEVRKFVTNGKDVKICNTMQKAMRTYKKLYDYDSVSIYLTMRDNFEKYKDYLKRAVLVMPPEDEYKDLPIDEHPILVEPKVLVTLNKDIPEQWKMLDKFKKELENYAKSEVEIYGGGEVGAYEQ